MQPTFFSYDFGRTKPDFWKKPITNPVDLIGREAIQALLGLCQTEKTKLSENASDYELFRALCRAEPLLLLHPLPQRLTFLLARALDVSLPLSADFCDEIWMACADRLCKEPMTQWELLCKLLPAQPIRCLLSPSALPHELLQNAEPILDATDLHKTEAVEWPAWERELQATMDAFAERGCQTAFYTLPKGYKDLSPNPYAVEQALQGKEKNVSLLTAQLFRFLSEACRARDWALVLRVEALPEDTLSLLERTERTVGLPSLIWATPSCAVRDALLCFSSKPHKGLVRCAMTLSDYPSEEELSLALSAYAARYPLGALAILTGGALCDIAYERVRFLSVLSQKR